MVCRRVSGVGFRALFGCKLEDMEFRTGGWPLAFGDLRFGWFGVQDYMAWPGLALMWNSYTGLCAALPRLQKGRAQPC